MQLLHCHYPGHTLMQLFKLICLDYWASNQSSGILWGTQLLKKMITQAFEKLGLHPILNSGSLLTLWKHSVQTLGHVDQNSISLYIHMVNRTSCFLISLLKAIVFGWKKEIILILKSGLKKIGSWLLDWMKIGWLTRI